jgi:hypothetical protein
MCASEGGCFYAPEGGAPTTPTCCPEWAARRWPPAGEEPWVVEPPSECPDAYDFQINEGKCYVWNWKTAW